MHEQLHTQIEQESDTSNAAAPGAAAAATALPGLPLGPLCPSLSEHTGWQCLLAHIETIGVNEVVDCSHRLEQLRLQQLHLIEIAIPMCRHREAYFGAAWVGSTPE